MPATQSVTAPPDRKPRDDEIDIYGLTHPGRVRKDNQDHFLVCALHKSATVQHSSLPLEHLHPGSQRVALLMMVADGVGGGHRGEEASRLALEGVTGYVTRCMACYYGAASSDDTEFYTALQEVARQCHEELVRRGEEDPDYRGMREARLRRALLEARAARNELRLAIDTIPTIVWSTTADGTVNFVNRAWRDFTGLSAEHGRANR